MRSSTWVVAGKRAAYLGSGWQACCIHRLGVMGRAGALWQQAAQPRPSVAALGGTHRTWDSHTGPALGGTHRTWDSHTGPVCARWAQLPAVVSPTHVVVHSGRQQQRHSSHWVAAAAALPLGGSSSSEAPLQHALHTATTCPFMVSCIAAHNLSCETFSVKSSIGQAEHSSVSAPVQEYRCLLTEYYSVR